MLADSLELSLSYAERLLVGVTPEKFCRLANTGRSPIRSNHAAFIYGHLSLYGPETVEHVGGDTSNLAIPAKFETVFSKDASCEDDEDGKIYPPMNEVTEFFFLANRSAVDALRNADDLVMQNSNPLEGRMAELFPTIGSLVGFYVGGHVMMHLGQMSAWRRMLGLAAA